MGEFEYLLSLFGLLLGLALTEGLSGLANALNTRQRVTIGWPTTLLGIYVSCNIVSFWINGWRMREALSVTWPTMFGGFVITAISFIAASLIFPKHADDLADIDGHFERNRRTVLGGLLLVNAAMLLALHAAVGLPELVSLRMLVVIWSAYPATIVAMFARRRGWVVAALAWLVAIYPLSVLWRIALA